jgi:malonyl-CoA/methylmalonyl-CoA synthetase
MDTFYTALAKSLKDHSEKNALTFIKEDGSREVLSYGGLDELSSKAANYLVESGLKRSQPAILYVPKSIQFVIYYLAIQKVGAIAVPLNPTFVKSEMSYYLADTDARLIVTGGKQYSIINEISPNLVNINVGDGDIDEASCPYKNSPAAPIEPGVEGNSPSLIIYTSGTTGTPKGAVISQNNLIHDAKNVIEIWGINEKDVLLHALPLFHVHGLGFALHTSLLTGAHVLMTETFNAEKVIELLTDSRRPDACTIFMAVPSMYIKLMDFLEDKKLNFKHLRLFTSGSAPLLESHFAKIKDVFGKEPVEREGMTETGMNFSNPLKGARKPGSIGLPLPGLKIRIVDPDTGEEVKQGQVGELWLKSPSIISRYWNKPDETKNAFKKGWFKTGDLGRVDGEGYYYLTDRLKNIIISGGENISPKEVEQVINQMGDIEESVVVGLKDPKWGEMVAAAIKARPGSSITEAAIMDHCRTHLQRWKCPRKVILVSEFQKNSMGKILVDKARELFDE